MCDLRRRREHASEGGVRGPTPDRTVETMVRSRDMVRQERNCPHTTYRHSGGPTLRKYDRFLSQVL
jgi:hypothetical protein